MLLRIIRNVLIYLDLLIVIVKLLRRVQNDVTELN